MTNLPLLITRPAASADRFVAGLARDVRDRTKIIFSPLLDIVPLGVNVDLSSYSGVIFTSSNGVAFSANGNGMSAYCVGETTAKLAQSKGWRVSATSLSAKKLIKKLTAIPDAGPLLHLAGRHRRGDVDETLSAMGIKTDVETLYDQVLAGLSSQALEVLKGEGQVLVPLFSPRTAAHFITQVPDLHNVRIIAISDAVAELFKGLGAANVSVAAAPTGDEMRRSVEKALCDTSLA